MEEKIRKRKLPWCIDNVAQFADSRVGSPQRALRIVQQPRLSMQQCINRSDSKRGLVPKVIDITRLSERECTTLFRKFHFIFVINNQLLILGKSSSVQYKNNRERKQKLKYTLRERSTHWSLTCASYFFKQLTYCWD